MKPKEEHFHTLRVISTLRGKKAYCIQPRCEYSAPIEQFHRKLLECESCFEHFLFDYDTYDLKEKEVKILCWKCKGGATEIGLTLEQQKRLLEREIKAFNLSIVEELEAEYSRKKIELGRYEKSLEYVRDELDQKEVVIKDKELALQRRKRQILNLIQQFNHNKREAKLIAFKREKEKVEKERAVKEKVVKPPKVIEPKVETPQLVQGIPEFEGMTQEQATDAIFRALTKSLETTSGDEGSATTNPEGT